MAKTFNQQIIEKLPLTRRYARALIGDTELANEAVLHAVTSLSNIALPWVPEKMVHLYLLQFVHEYVDRPPTSTENSWSGENAVENTQLIDQVDTMLQSLSEHQRRIYLLLTIESLKPPLVARLLKTNEDDLLAEFESITQQLMPTQTSAVESLPKAA